MLRYQARISGPLLDRIDLQIEVPAVDAQRLAGTPDGEPSAVVEARVHAARQRALDRQGTPNNALAGVALERHCRLDAAASAFLQSAATRLGWSARGFHRIQRIDRTIADVEAETAIVPAHLAEAIQYRRVLS